MSEILFKRLRIENFLSIEEGSLGLDNRGLLLIQGVNNDDPSANSNGAGKSSVVDALAWCLYSTTARGLSGDAVVNRVVGKNCCVEVTFTLNGKTYIVTRYRRHSKGKNRLMLTCDGNDLTLGTDKLTQDLVERTIGCNLDVFTASIYAGQNSMPNLPALTDKALKQLVEQAAGIELLDGAYNIARERARSAGHSRDAAEALNNQSANFVETQRAQVATLAGERANWETTQAERIKRAQQALLDRASEAKRVKADVDAADEEGLQSAVRKCEQALLKSKRPLVTIEAPAASQYEVLPSTSPACVELERKLALDIRDVESSRQVILEQARELRNVDAIVGTACSECGKPYHKEDVSERRSILVKGILERKERQKEQERVRDETRAKLDEQRQMHEASCHEIELRNAGHKAAYDKALAAYRAALQAQRDEAACSDSTRLMGALKHAQNALQQHDRDKQVLHSKLEVLRQGKTQLEELKATVNPYDSPVAAAHAALNAAQAKHKEASDKLDECETALADLKTVAELFSPKGMRGEVLDQVTPFLNARTAQYLGVLSDGSITAEWKTIGETSKGEVREQFHIAVQNANGAEVYEGNSGGEQRKIRIATAMALQDLVASRADRPIKLFIADEVDDALDVSGLERLMAVLEEKARSVGTVLIISHNDLNEWMSNVVTVVKNGGKSQVVEV